jgi:hypothetical protein
MNGTKYLKKNWLNIIEAISNFKWFTTFWVIVITNQEVKKKIRPISWNQSVVTDCSHLFVFAAWDTYTADRINKMFDLTNTIRDMKTKAGKITVKCF